VTRESTGRATAPDPGRTGILLAVGPLPPPVNGLSKAFAFVVEGMSQRGWIIDTVDLADRTKGRVGSSFSWGRFGAVLAVLSRVIRRARRADVVYLTISQSRLGFAKDMVAIRYATRLGRPVVVHMHGGNFGGFYRSLTAPEQHLVKGTLDRLAAIVVLTDSLKRDFSMTNGWAERTVAIANTCDVPPGGVRRPPSGTLRLLFLSALILTKGYPEAIAAAAEIARRRPDLRVTIDIAGGLVPDRDFPGPEAQREDLRQRIGAMPSNASAVVHGEVDGARKQALLAGADVFLLPTRYVNEGQPISIIEALTAGLPVVATDWRGIRETLPPVMHELLVPAPDAGAIADRLERLVTDPLTYEAMSRAATVHAELFRPERHLQALDRVLRAARAEVTGS